MVGRVGGGGRCCLVLCLIAGRVLKEDVYTILDESGETKPCREFTQIFPSFFVRAPGFPNQGPNLAITDLSYLGFNHL